MSLGRHRYPDRPVPPTPHQVLHGGQQRRILTTWSLRCEHVGFIDDDMHQVLVAAIEPVEEPCSEIAFLGAALESAHVQDHRQPLLDDQVGHESAGVRFERCVGVPTAEDRDRQAADGAI